MKLKTLLAAALAATVLAAPARPRPSVWRSRRLEVARSLFVERDLHHGMLANVYEGLTSAERT